MAAELPVTEQSYGDREVMLYALGIGLGNDPLDRNALRYTTEKDLKTIPTMATVLGWATGYLAAMGVDHRMVVHGEQRLELHKTLPVEATIVSRRRVREAYDKGAGKGAVILVEQTVLDKASEETYATLLSTVFARGDGGFGGPSGSPPPLPETPDGPPDAVCDLPTSEQSALVYRLSGDRNPLHCDPEFAQAAGFPKPILHGLCTYGNAAHALIKTLLDYDADRLKSFNVRFTSPVYPGETIRTEMWQRDGQVLFRSKVVERDVVVLARCVADIA